MIDTDGFYYCHDFSRVCCIIYSGHMLVNNRDFNQHQELAPL